MTNEQYLKKAYVLSVELERALLAKPYDPNVHQDVIERLQALHSSNYRRRRRRPWFMILLILFCLCILVGLIIRILFLT